MMLITHDLGVVAGVADDVMVMYAGRIAEYGPSHELFAHPTMPYTRGLLRSIPRSRPGRPPAPPDRRHAAVDDLIGDGCAFVPRCASAAPVCSSKPSLAEVGPGHLVNCHFPDRSPLDTARDSDHGECPEATRRRQADHRGAGAPSPLSDTCPALGRPCLRRLGVRHRFRHRRGRNTRPRRGVGVREIDNCPFTAPARNTSCRHDQTRRRRPHEPRRRRASSSARFDPVGVPGPVRFVRTPASRSVRSSPNPWSFMVWAIATGGVAELLDLVGLDRRSAVRYPTSSRADNVNVSASPRAGAVPQGTWCSMNRCPLDVSIQAALAEFSGPPGRGCSSDGRSPQPDDGRPRARTRRLAVFVDSEHLADHGLQNDLPRWVHPHPMIDPSMLQIVEHLVELGCETIVYVGTEKLASELMRRQSLTTMLRRAGLRGPIVYGADRSRTADVRRRSTTHQR